MMVLVSFSYQLTAQRNEIILSNSKTRKTEKPVSENAQGFSIEKNRQDRQYIPSKDVTGWISIGTGSSPWGSYNYPIDMYWNTSLSQSIYTAEEINHGPCAIEQIIYNYKTLTNNYPSIIDTEQFRLWIGNTNQSSLSEEAGYWIPSSALTLVYEGIVILESGEDQEMVFELSQPFIYNGGNICIMVEHVLSPNQFQNHFNFKASNLAENDVRARVFTSFETSFNFSLPGNDPAQTGMTLGNIADVTLGINTLAEGSLAGTITNPDGEAIENVQVSVVGTDLLTYSDAQGYYSFPFIAPGNYTINYAAFGYVSSSMNIEIGNNTIHDLTLDFLPKGMVQGRILDNDNNPIEGANITLNGYASYNATSNELGNFSIPDVYYDNDYMASINKNGYQDKSTPLSVDSPLEIMPDIFLDDQLEAPSKAEATKSGSNAVVTWLSPSERKIYRRDGGTFLAQIGHNFNEELAVFGQVFREAASLYQMSWYTKYIDQAHDFVNVFVFALDNSGNPTNTILFEQENVPNVDDQWTSFTFPDTITTENGFMIALSYAGRLELGIDAGLDPEYPYVNNVNWVSEDYTTGAFVLMEDLGLGPIPGNLMIRAEGYKIETGEKIQFTSLNKPKSLNSYKVYRFEQGQEQNPDQWTLLAQDITEKSFTDESFSNVNPGWYRYAVVSVYSGGLESLPALSNLIENGLTAQITFNITTNTNTNESMGAVINLTSNNGGANVYSKTVDNENGVVVFEGVFKGIYDISVTLDRFDDYTVQDADFSENPSYSMDCQLIESLIEPFNLEVIVNDDFSALLKWNHTEDITENFESCNDFSIEPQGVVKWKYIDVDNATTVGINNFEYLNENEPHSFMIFNPSQTTPPISLELNPTIAPNSGDKYLVSFGAISGQNDDYFITPELNLGQEFTFKFAAKSFDTYPAPNKIMVGYSITGCLPEDFIWLTETPVILPADHWYEYEYQIIPEAKYVCIRNVSDGAYILMIDDVELFASQSTKSKQLVNYKVYLNDEFVGETNDFTYTFEADDLLPGQDNEAGVQSVYSTGESEITLISFYVGGTGLSESKAQSGINVYPNPSDGNFTISLDGKYEVSIINSIGVTVYNKTIAGHEQITIDGLEAGCYVISARSDNKVLNQIIVIRK